MKRTFDIKYSKEAIEVGMWSLKCKHWFGHTFRGNLFHSVCFCAKSHVKSQGPSFPMLGTQICFDEGYRQLNKTVICCQR